MLKRTQLSLSISLILAFSCEPVAAAVIEELVVTAQKDQQNIQDVNISMSAFSGEQISALGMTDTTKIVQQIPALQINAWSPNVTIFNLRGISQNNFQDNLEAPVAVYIDDAYMGSLNGISGQLFDIKRVEVLRGPQGTLFGRNATGGLIQYISQGADSREFTGYVSTGIGSYNRRNVEFAAGGELADKIRTRFAGRWEKADGYIKAIVPGVRDLGGANGFALRDNLQIDFTDKFTGDFWLKYSKDTDVPTGGYAFENCPTDAGGNCLTDNHGRSLVSGGTAAGDPHKHANGDSGYLYREVSVGQGKLTYEFENGNELVSITNLTKLHKSYFEDGDGLPAKIVTLGTNASYKQWSQELRLSGATDRTRWQTGLYYLNINIDEFSPLYGAPALFSILLPGRAPASADLTALSTGTPDNGFENARTLHNWSLDSTNWSVFGQGEYDLTDEVTGTLGLRWSQDKKNMDFTLRYADNYNPVPMVIDTDEKFDAIVPSATKIDRGDWAGRAALDWHVTPDHMLFISANRGIKGGNFTASIGENITPETFKHGQEVLYAYETGFKSRFNNLNLRINGTAFYYNYVGYQAFSLAGGAPLVKNTGASAQGGEMDLTWTPGTNWDFVAGLTYEKSDVNQITGPGIFGQPSDPIFHAELPNAPRWSVNYLARYNWDVSAGNLAIQVDGVWRDKQFLEVTNGPGTVQDAYEVTNVRLTYATLQNKLTLGIFAENVFDTTYKAYTLDLGNLGETSYYAPPRTYGANVKYAW